MPSGLWVDSASEIGVVAAESGLFVGWLDVAWSGPGSPEWLMRDVVHVPPHTAENELRPAIERARSKRGSALRRCRLCSGCFIPGHMHAVDICQGCAERHLGVVH